MKNEKNIPSKSTRNLTLAALLFATSLVFSIIESMAPPLPFSVPGVKLGLSNVPVMYALFFTKKQLALTIAVLKSFFVLITRGMIAGLLSFCGGMLSVLVMALLIFIFRERISYFILSISGAVCHNMGQLVAISVLYTNLFLWAYLPVLLIAGILAGAATATLLKFVLPALKKLGLR